MAEITAALVKELRDRTGAGIMDCKKALGETEGELGAAIDWLRQKGLAAVAKRADRLASDGLIGVITEGTKGALIEVNSETDFVARNELMQSFTRNVVKLALDTGVETEGLLTMDYPEGEKSVQDELNQLASSVGENVTLRRTAVLTVTSGRVASYVHNALEPGLGRIGVLVSLECTGDSAKVAEFGKLLAMHIAATSPQALDIHSLDSNLVESERSVLRVQAEESGRSPEIVEKMVEGRLRKFYEEVILTHQTFVIDGESKVSDVIKDAAEEIGAPLEVTGFIRYALGEGIEREGTA